MNDSYTAGGRPMSAALAHALDDLTGRHRESVIAALWASGGVLAPLCRALAVELGLCELREEDALRGIAELSAEPDTDERPWPQATGRAVVHDPETGEWRELPGDDGGPLP